MYSAPSYLYVKHGIVDKTIDFESTDPGSTSRQVIFFSLGEIPICGLVVKHFDYQFTDSGSTPLQVIFLFEFHMSFSHLGKSPIWCMKQKSLSIDE